jgi:hypothetical protein
VAFLYLTLDDEGRAWKTFDWEAMNRLYQGQDKGSCDKTPQAASRTGKIRIAAL